MLRSVRSNNMPQPTMTMHAASVQRDIHGGLNFHDPVKADRRSKPLQTLRDPPHFTTIEQAKKEQNKHAPKEMSKKKEQELIEEELSRMLFDREESAHDRKVEQEEKKLRERRDNIQHDSEDDD